MKTFSERLCLLLHFIKTEGARYEGEELRVSALITETGRYAGHRGTVAQRRRGTGAQGHSGAGVRRYKVAYLVEAEP